MNEVVQLVGMIKLSYGQVNNRVFNEALEKLDQYNGFTTKEMFDFNKLKGRWDREVKRARKTYGMLIRKHAVKDKDGKVNMEHGMPEMGDKDAYKKEFDEFLSHSFEFKCAKFNTELLQKAGLTPKQVRACTPILADGDPEWVPEDPGEEPDDGDDQLEQGN